MGTDAAADAIEPQRQSEQRTRREIMKRTTKLALVAGSALTIALAGAAVNAQGGWGGGFGYGMGPGYHMGYGYGPMGYGMGPGHMGYGYGPHMGYGGGPRMGYGGGWNGPQAGSPGAVGERLDSLKSTLAITDKQQAAWQGFADSVAKQAQNRQAWYEKMRESQAPRTAPEFLAQRNEAMKQRQADNESVTVALTKLYDVLTPEQRSVIDDAPGGGGWCPGWR
jgi:hypothetical protein